MCTRVPAPAALLALLVVSVAPQAIKIDWSGVSGHRTPTLDLDVQAPSSDDYMDEGVASVSDEDAYASLSVETVRVDPMGWATSATPAPEQPPAAPAAPPEEDAEGETPRGSMRATLRRLGARLPRTDSDQALRDALDVALGKARVSLLRGLLLERGGVCTGCTERHEFVAAVLSSLRKPLVARHALPLFLYDTPLFPLTQTGLNLYEPRYKLLCRKALKADQIFGFVRRAHHAHARTHAHAHTYKRTRAHARTQSGVD